MTGAEETDAGHMTVLVKNVTATLTVKNSRFLAELLPCNSQQDARELLKSQKAKYKDAAHVVHAFVVGADAQIRGMSDDGEPSGTAGRPVLDVLCNASCTNALLTVTRWFGGTLLGTGGLVKAYGDAAKLAIAAAVENGAFAEFFETRSFSFSVDYARYEKIKRMMKQFSVSDMRESFGSRVEVSGVIHTDEYDLFATALVDASGGAIVLF